MPRFRHSRCLHRRKTYIPRVPDYVRKHLGSAMTRDRPYAGIGSRSIPPDVLELIEQVAVHLMLNGWTLRSGGGKGADRAFHRGAGMVSEIYLPEAVTGMHLAPKYVRDANWRGAAAIARDLHPRWKDLGNLARYHHTRTVCIILGPHLYHRARFLLCWTRDGATTAEEWGPMTGGTGFGIALASRSRVPVFNLQRDEDRRRVARLVTSVQSS